MNDFDKNNEIKNTNEENNTSSYIKERVIVKPYKKILRYFKKIIITIPLAVIFGVIACVVFVYLRPMLEDKINPTEPETTTEEETTEEEETTTEKIFTAEDLKEMYGQISEITAEMKKSYVTINAYDGEKEIFGTAENEKISSGVIVSDGKELHILAMYENVSDMDIIKVFFEDGSSAEATIQAYDKITGIVILSVDTKDVNPSVMDELKNATIANTKEISYAEPVVYIGNPFGMDVYETIGFLNGKSSIVTNMDIAYGMYRTDIFISECNDGFIFNLEGELLGVVNGGEKVVEAISAADISYLVKGLSNRTGIVYMGVYGEAVTEEIREISGMDMPDGVYVTSVEKNSPAYVSGIRKGDIIVKINSDDIKDMTDLKTCLKNSKSGNTLNVVVKRQNGDTLDTYTVEVELTTR